MSDQILKILGEIFLIGGGVAGAAGIAYLIFQQLGKSWIESKFSERLEQFKHQQALEIQRLRIEIDSTLSGVLKIQEKEFETLPEAWRKLDEANNQVTALVSPYQQYPDLNRMSSAQLEEFLAKSELFETQKAEIRESRDKVQAYQESIFWHKLFQVKMACSDLDIYVVRYGIFFPPTLKEKFDIIVEKLKSAVSDKEIGKEMQDYKIETEGWKKIKNEIKPLFKAIESDIHARLRSHSKTGMSTPGQNQS